MLKKFLLSPVANFIKLFWSNLGCNGCTPLSFYSDHNAARGINYAEKGFMKLATGVNFINQFVLFTKASA